MLVKYEVKDHIAWICLSRPEHDNRLNKDVIHELDDAIDKVTKNTSVYVVIITGEGECFAAGADMDIFPMMSAEEAKEYCCYNQSVFQKIEKIGIPTIAAVNGNALGGGFGLALSCDIRIVSEDAFLGLPEVGLGITPGQNELRRLMCLVGYSEAIRIACTGNLIRGDTAVSLGIANEVAPQEKVCEIAEKIASTIAKKAPLAVQACCECIHFAIDNSYQYMDDHQIELFASCFASNDGKEGISAFLEQRKPIFKGID